MVSSTAVKTMLSGWIHRIHTAKNVQKAETRATRTRNRVPIDKGRAHGMRGACHDFYAFDFRLIY